MKKNFKIIPPQMPNFVRFESHEQTAFDIADFNESEAKAFAKLMSSTFMLHWQTRKEKLRGKNTGVTTHSYTAIQSRSGKLSDDT